MSRERRRHNLYEEAKQVFSPESADEFMSYFPPVGWADVATKADLGVLRNEMDALRAELRGEMAELRGEMAELRGEMTGFRGEMAALRSEMHAMRAEGRAELSAALDKMRVWTVATMIALSGAFAAVTFGTAQLSG
jgi:hypothetical protein